jgi:hypothetical protein
MIIIPHDPFLRFVNVSDIFTMPSYKQLHVAEIGAKIITRRIV